MGFFGVVVRFKYSVQWCRLMLEAEFTGLPFHFFTSLFGENTSEGSQIHSNT